MPIGAMLPWKRANVGRAFKQLIPALLVAVALGLLAYVWQTGRSLMGPIGLFLAAWLVFGAMTDIWQRTGKKGNRLGRLMRLPRADWGKSVAHAGLGITMFGIAGLMAWELEDISVTTVGESIEIGDYQLTLTSVERLPGPNYMSTTATVEVRNEGRIVSVLKPEKRVYPVQAMPTTEAAIDNGLFRDIYVVIGDAQQNGGWALRSHVKPLANWIWAGTIIMALGGLLSLSDRRYRVAAGARKSPRAGVPAE